MSQEKNMLIRAIPLDIWERIDRFCRQRRMKRRDFLQLALRFLEGDDDEQEQIRTEEEARASMARVSQIKEEISAYEEAIKLKRRIARVYKDVEIIGEEKTQMNTILELNKLMIDLSEIIEKYVPKHEIPDDPEERRQMGFPERYWNKPILISREQVEKRKREMNSSETTSEVESDSWSEAEAVVEEWKKQYWESNKQNDETPAEEKAIKKEQVSRDIEIDKARLKKKIERVHKRWEKMERKKGKGSSKRERSISKKEIATEGFSRGLEDLDEEE